MFSIIVTSKFKKDYALIKKRGLNLNLLKTVINKLARGETLEAKYFDHSLKGNYIGFRECHIQPDWLLIYKIDKGKLYLTLQRTGTHSDLF